MRHVVIALAALVILLGLATTLDRISLAPAVVVETIIQCNDGTFAHSPEECPLPPVPTPVQFESTASAAVQPQITMQEDPIGKTFLKKMPQNYVYNKGELPIYASGPSRSTGEWPFVAPGILYWNVEDNKALYVYPGDISPGWWAEYTNQTKQVITTDLVGASLYPAALIRLQLTGNKDLDENLLPKEFLKYFNFLFRGTLREDNIIRTIEPFYSKSPIEWFANYASDQPVKVDTKERVLPTIGGSIMSKLSLHYSSKETTQRILRTQEGSAYEYKPTQSAEIVFRFDPRGIPLVIDELDTEGNLIERHTYTVQTTYNRDGVMNTPVDPRIVNLPPHLIVTVQDWEKWTNSKENIMR
ncbi:hypothetical protein HY489_05865 [Candidatus Woesearchaeota archaeon]|nr:hypothetical protein [Candidatus Woesearchaeota archaeon]